MTKLPSTRYRIASAESTSASIQSEFLRHTLSKAGPQSCTGALARLGELRMLITRAQAGGGNDNGNDDEGPRSVLRHISRPHT